jgi:hypothetical protein
VPQPTTLPRTPLCGNRLSKIMKQCFKEIIYAKQNRDMVAILKFPLANNACFLENTAFFQQEKNDVL